MQARTDHLVHVLDVDRELPVGAVRGVHAWRVVRGRVGGGCVRPGHRVIERGVWRTCVMATLMRAATPYSKVAIRSGCISLWRSAPGVHGRRPPRALLR